MKILVTSDIHIKDSAKHSKYKGFRLDQYIQVASLMNATAVTEGISHFIIAGDLLDKAVCSPVIYHTLYSFIDTLVDNIENYQVLICHGNHDTASNFFAPQDSTYYPLLHRCYPGVSFVHNQKIIIDGKTFYFRGWEKEFSYQTPPCDVFVSHYCLPTSVSRDNFKFPGELGRFDNVKELVILGDIHRFQFIDNKILLPGCPLQGSFSDDPNTGFCVINTDNLSDIERFSTREEEGLLKFWYSEDFDSDSYRTFWGNESSNGHTNLGFEEWLFQEHNIVYRERADKGDKPLPFDLTAVENLDLYEVLDTYVKDFKYKEELYKALDSSKKSVESFMNQELTATLDSISITNFTSIESLQLDFTNLKKLIILQGENGSGKSNLLQAIVWCLTGESHAETEDVIKTGTKYCEVTLTLSYQNKKYVIERSRGSKFEFTVTEDGKHLTASNKSEQQKLLEDALPFVKKLHLLYFSQTRDGLLSELNDADRVGLISEMAGLSTITSLSEGVETKVLELKDDLATIETELARMESRIEGLRDISRGDMEDPAEALTQVQQELQIWEQKKQCREDKQAQIHQDYRTKRHEKHVVRGGIAESIRAKYKVKSTEHQNWIARLNHEESQYLSEIAKLKDEIQQYTPYADKVAEWVCDRCGTTIKSSDYSQEHVDKAVSIITANNEAIVVLHKKCEKIQEKIQEIKQGEVENNAKCTKEIAEATAQIDKEIEELDTEESQKLSKLDKICTEIGVKIQELLQKQSNLIAQKGLYEKNLEVLAKIEETSVQIKKTKGEIVIKKEKYNAFRNINNTVFGADGLLTATVLEKLANIINQDENMQIVTTKVQKNGKIKPTLDINMNIDGDWQPYRRLSGGERQYADMYLLSKIIEVCGTVGYLAFDEVLKYSDAEYTVKIMQILMNMPVRHCFLIYHERGEMPDFIAEDPNVTLISVERVKKNSIYCKK